MARASITRRLSLLFVAASSAVLLALGLVIAAAVERHFVEQDMEILTRQMDLARHAVAQVEQPGDLGRIEHVLDDAMVGQHGPAVLVFGADGTPLLATEHAGIGFEQVVRSAAIEPPVPVLWTVEGRKYRGIAAAVNTGSTAATASPATPRRASTSSPGPCRSASVTPCASATTPSATTAAGTPESR